MCQKIFIVSLFPNFLLCKSVLELVVDSEELVQEEEVLAQEEEEETEVVDKSSRKLKSEHTHMNNRSHNKLRGNKFPIDF